MRCAEFEQRLNWLLDERRNPQWDESLREHAQDCSACQGLLTGQTRLQNLLAVRVAPSSPDLAQRTVALARLAVDPSARPSVVDRSLLLQRWLPPLIVIGATIMLLAVPVVYRSPTAGNGQAKHTTQRNTGQGRRGLLRDGTFAAVQPRRARRPVPIPPAATEPEQPANRAHPELAHHLNGSDPDPEEIRRLLRDLWDILPVIPDEHREPIDRITGGFLPLTSTISAAVDAIRRSLPAQQDSLPINPQALKPAFSNDVLLS